jgi:hypothetical protein
MASSQYPGTRCHNPAKSFAGIQFHTILFAALWVARDATITTSLPASLKIEGVPAMRQVKILFN